MSKSMTQGNAAKLILLFSLPIMAGNFLQQLYNTADSIIVGRFVSQSALASVGTCAPLTMLFIALAIGFSTGGSIIVSQYFGAQKLEDMRKSVATSLIMIFLIGFVLSVVGVATSRILLRDLLAVPESALEEAVTYMTIYCCGLVFQFTYNSVAAVLRSLGDSKATLYFLLISSVINIVLDLVLIINFNLGVAGAALATIFSQFVSAVVSLFYMFKKYEMLRFAKGEFRMDKEKLIMITKTGIVTTVQQCVVSMGHILIQRVINSFGTDLMTAVTAAGRVENYVLIPIFGFQAGMSTFTAQNVGAKQTDRVIEGYKRTLVMVVICCAAVVALIMVAAKPLIGIFGVEGRAMELGIQYLRCLTPFFVLFGFYMCTAALLQGSGDVFYAMLCTMFSLFLRIVLTYLLAYNTPLEYTAIWWAQATGWFLCSGMAFVRFKLGTWKKKALI
ncbi:MAG: MATE family efflux transporter [Ruminococcaceae bacterium]|nr:MATE family efflux transporter [Oscillospiraceae bacterium]